MFGTNVAQLLFEERSRRTVSNVVEPIQTMDILDRAVVSWMAQQLPLLSR